MKEGEEKVITKKNYLNLKENNLTKREAITANQHKIILEVEQENKKLINCIKIFERDVKKYRVIETEFKAPKRACGLD